MVGCDNIIMEMKRSMH